MRKPLAALSSERRLAGSSARWSRPGPRPGNRVPARASRSMRSRTGTTLLVTSPLSSADIGEKLVEPSVREWMQEQGAKYVRRYRNGVGAGERARGELRRVPRERREHVALHAVHREQPVHARDRV